MVPLKFVFLLSIAFLITPLDAGCRKKQSNPCGKGRTALTNYFCGRGPTHQDCPATYECVIAPNDAYAVCCPRSDRTTRTTAKPGSCPPPSTRFGSCIAECSSDSGCGGNLKCCGNCPRKCVNPVF